MGYKHYAFNLQKQVRAKKLTEDEAAARICKKHERAFINMARESVYLAERDKQKEEKLLAYEYRKLIKEGNRESCRQRKNRLNKERRAKLANNRVK